MYTRRKKKEDVSLEEQVLAVQAGDEETRHHLLSNYQPFIATCVSKVCKRYIDPKMDDEFSVGMMAFNDAIDSYSEDKGSTFLSFARLVITRKVIDYIRFESQDVQILSLDESTGEQDDDTNAQWKMTDAAKQAFQSDEESWYRQMEIEEYSKKLKEFKVSFSELSRISPKHQDARETAKNIARIVYENQEIRDYVLSKKRLPIKQLETYVDVSKKTIERNRKFILAIFVLYCEDYTYLKEYVKGVSG
ncbi:RNA polymerase sigma-I factor [Halalkalibacillus sediminis]|uniref:RNA polymerase sigma factor SigI n=1 Tax=Halalkalibacillus sediminis TaxID=2018042 RepID=A0A2I0QVC0_9BACI|nr:RNA polymerase sigma-I factor [Halalkalibacillus sediminis]PKR78239.1 RNA polymerase sigma-I factor [Halalkalibacillus sediminis]